MDTLKTGDVILYSKSTGNWLSSITGLLNSSNSNKNKTEYLHCGMILRDPVFVHSSLKGLYVWQTKWTHNLNNDSDSSDSESETPKDNNDTVSETNENNENVTSQPSSNTNIDNLSIEIVPLKQVLDEYDCPNITARVLSCDDTSLSNTELQNIHTTVTVDPKNIFPQEEIKGVLGYCDLSSYDWSATFLGYLYTKCNLLSKETQWHLLRSQDFAVNTENLRFSEGVFLNNDEIDLL